MAILSIDGSSIYYEVKGDIASNKTIAFFNGVMASTSSWEMYWPTFKKLGYKVIVHDFLGQLKSDKPKGPYSFKQHAYQAMKLFEHCDIKDVHIVGTSYGGEVAMRFAIDYPQMTKSISIIDSVSELDEVLTHAINNWIILTQTNNPEIFFKGMLSSIYGHSYLEKNKVMLEQRAKVMSKLPHDYLKGQKILYDTFLSDVTITDELHKITCPTLVVCGEDDILKPVKFSKIIADNIKQAEFVTLPDCGHVAIFEKSEELKSLLLGFIIKQSLIEKGDDHY